VEGAYILPKLSNNWLEPNSVLAKGAIFYTFCGIDGWFCV
jgi:hypothetical protein